VSVASRGPIVVDTDVFSAALISGSELAERYSPLTTGRLAFISFQTAAEIRFGALLRGWGRAQRRSLDRRNRDPAWVAACLQRWNLPRRARPRVGDPRRWRDADLDLGRRRSATAARRCLVMSQESLLPCNDNRRTLYAPGAFAPRRPKMSAASRPPRHRSGSRTTIICRLIDRRWRRRA
jgi:predicted nucleic acid-binding protein